MTSSRVEHWRNNRDSASSGSDVEPPAPSGPDPDGSIDPHGPEAGGSPQAEPTSSVVSEASRTIDLGSAESVQQIHGIGPVLSNRIAEYMADNPGATVDDLINVQGIGEGRLADIKEAVGG